MLDTRDPHRPPCSGRWPEPRATLSRAALRWALEAIVAQHLEHLGGSALGFRDFTNYNARSLFKAGELDRDYNVNPDEPL